MEQMTSSNSKSSSDASTLASRYQSHKRLSSISFPQGSSPQKHRKMDKLPSPTKEDEDSERMEKFPDYVDPSTISFFDDFDFASKKKTKKRGSTVTKASSSRATSSSSSKANSSSPAKASPAQKKSCESKAKAVENKSNSSGHLNDLPSSPSATDEMPLETIYEAGEEQAARSASGSSSREQQSQQSQQQDAQSRYEQLQQQAQHPYHQPQQAAQHPYQSAYQQTPHRIPFPPGSYGDSSSSESTASTSSSGSSAQPRTGSLRRASPAGSLEVNTPKLPKEAPLLGKGQNYKDPFFYNMFLDFKKGVEEFVKEGEAKAKRAAEEKAKLEADAAISADKGKGKMIADLGSDGNAHMTSPGTGNVHIEGKGTEVVASRAGNAATQTDDDNTMDFDGKE